MSNETQRWLPLKPVGTLAREGTAVVGVAEEEGVRWYVERVKGVWKGKGMVRE